MNNNKLISFIGAWKGKDLDECLESVYNNRGLIMILDSSWRKCLNCSNEVHLWQPKCGYCGHNPHINALRDELQRLNDKNKQLFENIEQLRIIEENLKFKHEKDTLTLIKLSGILRCKPNDDDIIKTAKRIKEQNEKLTSLEKSHNSWCNYLGIIGSDCNCNLSIIEQLKAENEQLKFLKNDYHRIAEAQRNAERRTNESYKIIDELKAENESLNKQKVMLRNDNLSRQIKNLTEKLNTQINCNRSLANTNKKYSSENENLKFVSDQYERLYKDTHKLLDKSIVENQQLKAQSQNSDTCQKCGADIYCRDCMAETIQKATNRLGWGDKQTERKPHKCPVCYGKGKIIITVQSKYEMLTNDWFKDAEGIPWRNCNTCNGAGIVWESK